MEFKYRALDSNGNVITGTTMAESEEEAVSFIRGRQLQLINLQKEEPKAKDIELPFLKKKVKLPDLTMFCKQLSTMLDSGIPLSRALDIQAAQTLNPTMQSALQQVSSSIKQGMPLSKAMRRFPNVFPGLLLNMIEAGELTGKLDETLERMHVHYAKENRMNSKMKGAMIYPAVLGVLTISVIIIMLTFVMPMFMDMFGESDLPGLTLMMVKISDSLRDFWYIYVIVTAGSIYGFRTFVKTEGGREMFDGTLLKIPVIKGIMNQIITARFTRTLSTLLSSGISIIKALESASETTNNVIVMGAMNTVINDVKKGHSVSTLLKRVPVFPPMMLSMLSVGEETGAVDDMLAKTADYYDEVLDAAMSRLVALMEPLMIVVMGVSIGLIVVAMYLPMLSMFETMQF